MAIMGKTGGTVNGSVMKVIVTWPVIVVPLLFGVIVTILASIGSARSATAVTPLEALRPVEVTDARKAGIVRGALGVLMILVGVVGCVFGASRIPVVIRNSGTNGNDTFYQFALLAAVAGCALFFLGLVITATFWLPVLMRGVGALIAHIGPSAKIADANIRKNPRRVAATGVALLIGVTLVSTVATGAACGKETMGGALDAHYSVDMVASGEGVNRKVAAKIAKVKGIENTLYAPVTSVDMKDQSGATGNSVLVVGVESSAALSKVLRADLSSVNLDEGTVLMPKIDTFSGKEIKLGPTVDLTDSRTATRGPKKGYIDRKITTTLKTVQIDYRKVDTEYQLVAFVNASHFANGDFFAMSHMVIAKVGLDGQSKDGASKSGANTLAKVFEDTQSVLGNSSHVSLKGPAAERQQWNNTINQMMILLVGLLAVAVLIALIGVANTLSLSVIERTRESATLRAIGMTRGQLKRSLACEALLISLVSGVVGVILGTAFGWLGSYMVFSTIGQTAYLFDWKFNGAVLLIAALAALVSSIFPARRAVKTPPIAALAEA
ncbi:FtsX-like permease family protein [Bifidobacterium sp. ESL0690]|uniref:FtsX-like permease family protein n=1 Tax=Bifidobacterium sp. ESL0690 TaxID=2983214 RepID=UPI0023F83F49|nr:FtsX-like permease family protein [Bifidobacterium sp. ESL0690]WEV47368.1 FtsX-like permease family protein [Bifidobacterium sp. ESL0690]